MCPDLTPGTVRLSMGDAHLYKDHIGVATIQMNRVPYAFPTLKINRKKDGLWNIQLEEIELENYRFHPRLKAEMAV